MTTERKRIDELDFLKCVFIVLMIVFHLAYFGDMHPVAKKFVYTFHMPAFLFLAGYLANTAKPWHRFGSYLLWLVVSLLLFVFRHVRVGRLVLYIGRHTLIILLFSPIFTLLSKAFIPLFAFDPTALSFMVVAVVFVLAGCFALARLLDFIGISRFLLGKNKTV